MSTPKSTDKRAFFTLLNASMRPPAKAGAGTKAGKKNVGYTAKQTHPRRLAGA